MLACVVYLGIIMLPKANDGNRIVVLWFYKFQPCDLVSLSGKPKIQLKNHTPNGIKMMDDQDKFSYNSFALMDRIDK